MTDILKSAAHYIVFAAIVGLAMQVLTAVFHIGGAV